MNWPQIIIFLVGLAGFTLTSRIVWREIVLPIRDKFLNRIDRFFTSLEENITRVGKKEPLDTTLKRQEDILWRIHETTQETQDICERMSQPTGLPSQRIRMAVPVRKDDGKPS